MGERDYFQRKYYDCPCQTPSRDSYHCKMARGFWCKKENCLIEYTAGKIADALEKEKEKSDGSL